MHGLSAHSALAIKRQRKRREFHKKDRTRRPSTGSILHNYDRPQNQVLGTITMGHVGITFLLIGILLFVTAFLPGNHRELPELIGTGCICLIIGIFLTVLDKYMGSKEEKELTKYVEAKLGRTRSGSRIVKVDSDLDSPSPSTSHTPTTNTATNNTSFNTKQNKNAQNPQIVINIEEDQNN